MRRHSFVDIVFVAVVGVLASHACVGHVVGVGHAASVGVHALVGGTLVGAVVLLVYEAGGFLLELVEIHDDGCSDGRCDLYGGLIKVVIERMSWQL